MTQKKHQEITGFHEVTESKIVIITFEGICLEGSQGNAQGEFIYTYLQEIISELNQTHSVIVDFSKLTYTFGNYIFNAIFLLHKLTIPRAIVYGEKSKAIQILEVSNLFFEDMKTAVAYLNPEK
jgi:hypothetical protein